MAGMATIFSLVTPMAGGTSSIAVKAGRYTFF
jgi:hypothetical protein